MPGPTTGPRLDRVIQRVIVGPSPGDDGFGHPLPGPETTESVWAARMDFRAGDFVDTSVGGLVSVADSRYVVRDAGDGWAVDDTFTDEDGARRTVRGVSVQGRGYLELLCRRVSAA